MKTLLWMSLGFFFLGGSLFAESSKDIPDFAKPISRKTASAEETAKVSKKQTESQDTSDLPSYAKPINASRLQQQKKETSLARPTSYSDDAYTKKTLAERLDYAEKWMDDIENFTISANPKHGSFFMEFLYWKAKTDFDLFAFTLSHPSRALRMDFDWDVGSRIGWEQMLTSTWSSTIVWTYYHNDSSDFVSKLLVPAFFGNQATSAKGGWRLNYNMIDCEFASCNYLTKGLFFKPYIGVRAGWLKHGSRFVYNYQQIFQGSILLQGVASAINRESFWGVGPRTGTFVGYAFGKSGFHIFGNGSAALLMGRVHVLQNLELHVPAQSGSPAINLSAFGRDGFNDLKATLQALLGAEYKYDFDKGKKAFSLYATWETNYWWNLNNFVAFFSTFNPSFLSMPNADALILFGITGGLSFAY